jgi:hypothetical protein
VTPHLVTPHRQHQCGPGARRRSRRRPDDPAAPPSRNPPGGSAGQQRRATRNIRRTPTPQADNSPRPLRRRAARMARPARVRMRNRNPWVLARRRLFGWNVRLPLVTAVVLLVLGAVLVAVGLRVAAVGTAGRRAISLPVRTAGTAASGSHLTRGPNRAMGEGTQEYPLVGGRRPEPRRPVPVPSKPASRVTVRATRRYIDGACLHGVLVAAPQAC